MNSPLSFRPAATTRMTVRSCSSGFELNSTDLKGDRRTLAYHRYAETLKFAYNVKKSIRDPEFSPDDVKLS